MSYVESKSVKVPPPEYFCPVIAPMQDEAWNVEWGNLKPLNGGLPMWHQVEHFRGSCHEVKEQYASVFNDEEAYVGEDGYEPHRTACELAPGELPSIGSKDHASGECKRCAFFSKGRCMNGKECSHCHYPHEERKRRNRRSKRATAAQVEDNADCEDNQDDVDAQIVERLDAAFVDMPLLMPAQTCCNGFDSMLQFGSVTPELQTEPACPAVSSFKKVTDEDEEKSCDAPAEAFSSLLNGGKQPVAKVEHTVADTEDPQCTKKGPKQVARPKARSMKGSQKSSRAQLLAFALGAPPTMSEEDEENPDDLKQESLDSDTSAPNVDDEENANTVKVESIDANVQSPTESVALGELEALEKEAACLEAEALAAEKEVQRLLEESRAHCIATNATQEKKPAVDREADTTASSGEITSDAGATEHDFSSADKADQTSSDSDVASDCDSNAAQALPEELCTHRPERRHRKTSKQVSGVTRAPKRSPLWPTRAPIMSPAASPVVKTVSPEGEPKKEKTSWAALAQARREAASADQEVAVVRQARGILNKLTDANFERLYTQLVECGIRSATQLEAVIMEIFEKATTQHGFLPMYVELCVRLKSHFEKEPIEGADFRKLLVAACQRTFEQNIQTQPKVDTNLCYEDRYEVELKFKTRMLGNLRFVGELLVRKLLAGKILLAVSEELLSIGDGASIEAAAALLTVAGPAFDRKSWVFLPRLHAIFTMMRCISKDKAIPMRVRCILKDLIDLREAGWQKNEK